MESGERRAVTLSWRKSKRVREFGSARTDGGVFSDLEPRHDNGGREAGVREVEEEVRTKRAFDGHL